MWQYSRTNRQTGKPIVRLLCLGAVGFMTITMARANEYHLATGKIINGALVSETNSNYVIQTEVGSINVAKSDVMSVVDMGTTPGEIDGDIAAKNNDFAKAKSNYQQALFDVKKNSPAAARLKEKIQHIGSTTRAVAKSDLQEKYNRAKGLLQNRQYSSAELILEDISSQVSAEDPLSSHVLQMQAQVHYGKGMALLDAVKLDSARQELEAAIDADPTFYRAYLDLGNSLLGNSATTDRGVHLIEEGLKAGGDQIPKVQRYEYLYKLADNYFTRHNYAKAAATFAALIPARQKYPAYADALDRAVESYVRMGEENLSSDFNETITNLNTALKLNPDNQKALFLLGRIYLDIGQVENAVVTLEKLVALKEDYPDAQHYLGRAYFMAHDNKKALSHLSMEIETSPDNYFAHTDHAKVLIAMGNYSGAENDLATAKTLDDSNWLAYYLTASLQFHQKNYSDAQKSLLNALDRKKTAVPAHLLMGRVLVNQDQSDAARKWLEQVADQLSAIPNLSYQYRENLADALTQLGNISVKGNSPRQAENYFNRALETVSDYAPAMVGMADTKLLMANDAFASTSKQDLYDNAESLYLKAIKKDPDNADFDLKLAQFYHHNKVDQGKAKKYYNLYVDNGGKDSRVNIWLAQVGGTPRPEIAPSTSNAAATTTNGMATITTSTTTMTSGTTGTMTQTTTETSTMNMPSDGAKLPIDAPMSRTPGQQPVGQTPAALTPGTPMATSAPLNATMPQPAPMPPPGVPGIIPPGGASTPPARP